MYEMESQAKLTWSSSQK